MGYLTSYGVLLVLVFRFRACSTIHVSRRTHTVERIDGMAWHVMASFKMEQDQTVPFRSVFRSLQEEQEDQEDQEDQEGQEGHLQGV